MTEVKGLQKWSARKPAAFADATSTRSSFAWFFSKKFKYVLSTLKGFLRQLSASSAAVGKFFQTFHPLGILFLACVWPACTVHFYASVVLFKFNFSRFGVSLGQIDSEWPGTLALSFRRPKSERLFSLPW